MDPIKLTRGPITLLKGVRWIFTHPRYLFLGALPALLAGFVLITAIALLAIFSGAIVGLFAPIFVGLWPWLAATITVALKLAIVAAGVVLAYVLFAATALAIGDPIYTKIAEEIEKEAGRELPSSSWGTAVKDSLILILKGLAVSTVAFLIGLIPVVGTVLAFAVTWVFVPFFLAEDLLGRTLVPKGYAGHDKTKLLMKDKAATWSFGLCSQLLFTIPFFAVFFMPASVAGASLLAQEMQELDEAQEAAGNVEA